jgi:hypothetical protein
MKRRRSIAIAILLILSIGNYSRLPGSEHIRAVQFLTIFAIGALSALLLQQIFIYFKKDEGAE